MEICTGWKIPRFVTAELTTAIPVPKRLGEEADWRNNLNFDAVFSGTVDEL